MDLTCPKCGKAFGEDDVNVRTDVAHCRGCGTDSSYATLKENEKCLKALHEAPPKNFKVELTDRGVGWGDVHLIFCRNAFRKGLYLTLVALLAGLGIGGFVWFHHLGVRDGMILAPIVSFLVIAFLTCIAATVQRTLEVEMKGGKGRIWTYWLRRGKWRAFEYDGKTVFSSVLSEDLAGRPVLTQLFIRNVRPKFLRVRIGVIGEDVNFLLAALIYALPKDASWFEPEPDRPETPEEAAARRVEEANVAKEARWARWRWLKFVAIVAVLVGLRIGFEHMDRRKSPEQEHQVRLLRAFAGGGDYWAVAKDMPTRASKSYQERVYRDLAKFDAVTALYKDFQATEVWNWEKLDDFVSRCTVLTNRLGMKKASAARDIALGRCTALIECCQRAKAALENEADANAQLKIKVDFKAKVETCTEKERNL